jgi:hypothetical protein
MPKLSLLSTVFNPQPSMTANPQVVVVLKNGTLWDPSTFSAVYEAGRKLEPQLLVSNYHNTSLSNCSLAWTLTAAASGVIGAGTILFPTTVPQGTVFAVTATPSVTLPMVTQPVRIQLNVSLRCHELPAARLNDWIAWVYPVVTALPSIAPLRDAGVEQRHGTGTRVAGAAGAGNRMQPGSTNSTAAAAAAVFASHRLLAKVKLAYPSALPLPNATSPWPIDNAVYIVTQLDADADDLPLITTVQSGARVLVAEVNPCLSLAGCPHGGPLVPYGQLPALFHSPWWVVSEVTPVGIGVPDTATVPVSLRDLAAADNGAIDNSFFPAFGPVPGRCDGRERAGTSFDQAAPGAESWLEAIFAQNFNGPSTGYTLGGARPVVVSFRVGNGTVVLNGLDLDLSGCGLPPVPPTGGGCPKAFPYPSKTCGVCPPPHLVCLFAC